MIRNSDTLTVEVEPRKTSRHRRVHFRNRCRLSVAFPPTGINGTEEGFEPFFRINANAPTLERDESKPPMRVVLRHAKTMMYLASKERWTKDPKQARDFRNGWWATVYAFLTNPRQLVIHYEFDDERYNLQIPVLGQAHA